MAAKVDVGSEQIQERLREIQESITTIIDNNTHLRDTLREVRESVDNNTQRIEAGLNEIKDLVAIPQREGSRATVAAWAKALARGLLAPFMDAKRGFLQK
jgi:predicted  nucleic acid-binding Zn-ribbon protein